MRAVLLVLGAVLALGLLAVADDGSVPWPADAESMKEGAEDVTSTSGTAIEAVDPVCYKACLASCCAAFWWQPWKCFTVCPGFCSLVCSAML